jgi:hypothetical protein
MAGIKIGFSTDPKNWISKVIRWFTNSKCSHTFIRIEESLLGPLIVESDAGGVQVQMYAQFNTPGNTLVYSVEPAFDLLPALKQAMTEYLNEPYDYTGVIGMAWVMFWRKLKRKVSNPLHRTKSMFCSAFVLRVLQIANDIEMQAGRPDPFPGAYGLIPQDTTAQDVMDLFIQRT